MKIFILHIILLFGIVSIAQPSTQINHKKDRLRRTNFNGSVKYVKIQYTGFNIPNQSRLTDDKIIQNEREIVGVVSVNFDRMGKIIKSYWYYYKDENDIGNKKWYTNYLYNEKDIAEKETLVKNWQYNYPIYDYLYLLKPDQTQVRPNQSYERNSIADYKRDSLHSIYEKYKYRYTENNQITEEKYFSLFTQYLQKANPDDIEWYTHHHTILFNYNDRGMLNYQQIKFGDGPGKQALSNRIKKWSAVFHAMGTESSYCEDLHFSYQYDKKDRLTDIVFFGCNDTLAKEHYTYDEKKDYITKIRRYTGGIGGPVSVPKTVDLYYDEHANVIKREFIQPSYHTFRFSEIAQITYYKYDYDDYYNWVKCYIYYTGKPEGEPTAVVERKIEYYES